MSAVAVVCLMQLCMACRRLLNMFCGSVWPGLKQRCADESDEAKSGSKRKVRNTLCTLVLITCSRGALQAA